MSKSQEKESARRRNPLHEVLESLVVPALEDEAAEPTGDFESVEILESDDGITVRGLLGHGVFVHVTPHAIDGERTLLRIGMLAGYILGNSGLKSQFVGTLLGPSPFHVQPDFQLAIQGRMVVGCDLVVRADDEPLVRMRIGELLRLSWDFDWYFPLHMPGRLRWQDIDGIEVEWDELPHDEIDAFLENAMQAPPAERIPRTLLQVAQGLCDWKTVLRLLREHPEEFPTENFAPLKMLACRELGRWLQAIRAASEGNIEDGRFPGAPWLSPSYMLALVEVGEEIEALRLLGRPVDQEPAFYDWLRGVALHRAGDPQCARKAFERYFDGHPGDMLGMAVARNLLPEDS